MGAISGIGALSFYPTKNLGALGDGGAVLLGDDAELAQRLRRLRNGGQSDRYRHEVPGINSRLDEMQAALLRVGLRHLPEWTERRRELAALYLRELSGSGVDPAARSSPTRAPSTTSSWCATRAVTRSWPRSRSAASARSSTTRSRCTCSPPSHRWAGQPGDFPVAEKAAREILSLPLYPEMTDEQARAVAQAVREVAPRV